MQCPRLGFVVATLAAALAADLAGQSPAPAQDYPTRPITLVVPFPAGGSIDTVARVLAERMKGALGQPVIVENITGAGGSIGVGRVAHAAPGGYTIGIGNLSTHVINGATYAPDYDVVNDFDPIALLTTEPMIAAARKTMPADGLADLIVWLKANADKASAAVGGTGDITQIAQLLFQKETGTRFQLVPYRGTVLALNDVIGGRIDLVFMQASSLLQQIAAGTIKGYAVMAPKRLAAAGDIPTTDEAGLPGFHIPYWFGLWAPKGTPKAVVGRLNAAVVEALADDAVRIRLNQLGREVVPREQQAPEALAALQRAEIAKWWPLIKAAGIKAE
jgi:tripartite-type tricarboxylate transporter receptor subunit TctC